MTATVSVWPAREVPLGGLRAMNVARSLPQRGLPTVGAWCFLDRFGPQQVTMRVLPHPHIGLQTVTWPLRGQIRHRDSLGNDVVLKPGELNLMTAGSGISHSEFSVLEDDWLDALQFWIALPEERRSDSPAFERHAALPTVSVPAANGADASVTVVIGRYGGATSPATTFSPLVGAQVALAGGSTVHLPLDPTWEHAIMAIDTGLEVDGVAAPVNDLLSIEAGADGVTVTASQDARLFLMGGQPLANPLVMWWNFVGSTHDVVATAREDWEAESARFGVVPGHDGERIPAPPMPPVTLTPRLRT